MLSCLCEACHVRASLEMDVLKEWIAKLDVSYLNDVIGILIAAQKRPANEKLAEMATEKFCNLIGMRSELIVPIVKHYFHIINKINDIEKDFSETSKGLEAF
jgi:hypothetical protein